MYRICLFASFFLALILCACGPIVTDAEVPDTATTNSTFPVTIFAEVAECGGQTSFGGVAIQIPNGWDADEVEYFGPDSGAMIVSDGLVQDYLDATFDPPAGYKWCGFQTEVMLNPEDGALYTILMTVHTDDLEGVVELSFHSSYSDDGFVWWGEADPLGGFFIEILPAAMEQETWAAIKSSFE